MGRSSYTEALVGPEVYTKIKETPILVVGAGGIGCELLKNLVLVGFGNIEIIDLDTIDLSNLNRQFLFRKPDISKSKALVAKTSALHFNPSSGINIHARHGNVKDRENDLEWIKSFGLVLNALDNLDARRHVNKLCQAAGVPLVESGTAGYLGQVQPIIKDRTECYDCTTKATPKSFPVCTIRATPSEPIHCIVWAKSYLFGKLFGEDDEAVDEAELDKAKADGENAEEIENLKKEALAFREVRRSLGEENGPRRVFEKVFHEDIERLLAMEDMWNKPGRVKPKALVYDSIMNGSFVPPPLRTAAAPTASTRDSATAPSEVASAAGGNTTVQSNGNGAIGQASSSAAGPSRTLRDQRELSVKENLELFLDSCRRLSARMIANPDIVLSFDKDDDDTLDFVLATANLRAIAYGIANKTRFQVKEMAGNIIPAIATTNAIIAGMIVMQVVLLLSKRLDELQNTFTRGVPTNPVGSNSVFPPNEDCAVCRDVYIPFKVDLAKCTLGEFVEDVLGSWLVKGMPNPDNGEYAWEVYEGGRLLADPDFDDNHSRTLADMSIERGAMISVLDEDGLHRPVHFCVCLPDETSEKSYTLPADAPKIPLKPKKLEAEKEDDEDEFEVLDALPEGSAAPPPISTAPTVTATGSKRSAPDDGDVSLGQDATNGVKKLKVTSVPDDDDDDFEIL